MRGIEVTTPDANPWRTFAVARTARRGSAALALAIGVCLTAAGCSSNSTSGADGSVTADTGGTTGDGAAGDGPAKTDGAAKADGTAKADGATKADGGGDPCVGAPASYGLTSTTAWKALGDRLQVTGQPDENSSLPSGARAEKGFLAVDGCRLYVLANNDKNYAWYVAAPPKVFKTLTTTPVGSIGDVWDWELVDGTLLATLYTTGARVMLYRMPVAGGAMEQVKGSKLPAGKDQQIRGYALFGATAYLSAVYDDGTASDLVATRVTKSEVLSGAPVMDNRTMLYHSTVLARMHRMGDLMHINIGGNDLKFYDRACLDQVIDKTGGKTLASCASAIDGWGWNWIRPAGAVKVNTGKVEILLPGKTAPVTVHSNSAAQGFLAAYITADSKTALVAYAGASGGGAPTGVILVTGLDTATPTTKSLPLPGVQITDAWTDGKVALVVTSHTKTSARIMVQGLKL